MKNYRIAAMGGDGIGPDVIRAGCRAAIRISERI